MIELRPAKYLLGRLVPMDNNDKIPLFNLGSGTYDNTKFLRGDGTWAVPSGGGGSYVPYTGATGNVDLGEYGLSAGWVQIDTSPTTYTPGVGKLGWNNSDGTLEFQLLGGNVTLQIGQEQVARVVNKTDPLIDLLESNYQVVKITGAQGNRLKIALAQANNDANSAETLGLVTEDIPRNQEGFITTSGIVRNINTTGLLQGETWADGDMLYLSGTVAGQMTKVKPVAPIHTVILGYVIRAHATQGQIYVKVDNGYELGELHDVNTNLSKATPVDTDSLLLQDTADSNIWKKLSWLNTKATLKTYFDTLYQAIGSYVPSSRTITINSTTQDLSTNRSWTIDKASVGLGNVDNTSDLNKPISTATQTALNAKQDNITLTTTGTSGAATLVGATLNIPQYQSVITNPITGTGINNYVSKFTGTGSIGDSSLYDDGTNVGIGTTSPLAKLHIYNGNLFVESGNIETSGSLRIAQQLIDSVYSAGNPNQFLISNSIGTLWSDLKTVNGNSLVGSENISVQPTLVSGTNIKTINGNSLLGSGDITISGGSPDNATHIINSVASGQQYSLAINANAKSNSTLAANQVFVNRFIPSKTFTINYVQLQVTATAIAGALARIVIFTANPSDINVPLTKILETTSFDCSTVGNKTFTISGGLTLTAGTGYFIGVYGNNSSMGLTILQSTSLAPIYQSNGNIVTRLASNTTTFGTLGSTWPGTAVAASTTLMYDIRLQI